MILTGVAFDGGWRATRFAGPGVVFAIVALVLFALMTITTDIALETIELAPGPARRPRRRTRSSSIAVARSCWRVRQRPGDATELGGSRAGRRAAGSSGAIVLAGVLDVAGPHLVRDRPRAAADLDGRPASSFGPAVTILVAVAFLGERLKPIQWVGLVGVAVGMIAIGLP